ncbi:MAG: protein kinase, partial [Burkholderiaceae bacterium]
MTMEKLGRYDIVRVLGKGAMGLVYEARDPNLDRRVAIKTIKVENLPEEAVAEYEARFRTEARSAARLQHPNIVSVYDSERHGDTAYLVMEFVQGEDLKHHLDGGRQYSLEQSLAIVRDLLAALEYAHKQNVVHRDVKPANLLMVESSGRVKLTDFGVARIQDSGELTRTKGSMVGTLKYMAPEQVRGKAIDFRADLFAAGVVLYQLLTGKRPFDGDSEFAIIHQIMEENPPAPSSINSALPKALDAVVARALAKDKERRYGSAGEFSTALRDAVAQGEDSTMMLPPAGSGQLAPDGSGSRAGAVRTLTSGSSGRSASAGEESSATVTQELELVYWKDVKETQDPADLEGFLNRFPRGIYADLASRRLKKITDQASGDLSGTHPSRAGPADGSTITALTPTTPAGKAGGTSAQGGAVAADPASTTAPVGDSSGKRGKGMLFAIVGIGAVLAAGLALKLTSAPTASAVGGAVPSASTPAPITPAVVSSPPPAVTPAPVPVPLQGPDKSSKVLAGATAVKPAAVSSSAKPPLAKPAVPVAAD